MEQTFSTFSYKSVDLVVDNMSEMDYMAVTDITSAYRSVLIRPCDRSLQGLKWEMRGKEIFIQDNFLSFGTRVAPFIFSRITDAVARYVCAHGYFCINYLDDFLVKGQDYQSCKEAQLFLHATLRSLGFFIAYNKVRTPSRVQLYLGIELDSISMKMRLPQDKVDNLHSELLFFRGRRRSTKKQLQRLCGVLGHCATLVRGGRTFSHRVIGMLKLFKHGKRYVTLSAAFHKDLEWWEEFANFFNGKPV